MNDRARCLRMLPAIRYGAFFILLACVCVLSFSFAFMFDRPSVFVPFAPPTHMVFGDSVAVSSIAWSGTHVCIVLEKENKLTDNAFSFSYMRSSNDVSRLYFDMQRKLLELNVGDYARYEDFISQNEDVANINTAAISNQLN